MSRKAQTGSDSAVMIIILTVLIVLYILFLPPQDRAELLGSSSSTSSSSSSSSELVKSKLLLSEGVGQVTDLGDTLREHSLPSFMVGTSDQGSVIKEDDSAYVRSSVFDFAVHNMTFRVDGVLASDLQLSFTTGRVASGRLIVFANGQKIVDSEFEPLTTHTVTLPQNTIFRDNIVTFAVSSPGWAFWSVHEYQLTALNVAGTLRDTSGALAQHVFVLSEEEADNLDRSVLRFFADCNAGGRLLIDVNGRNVYSSVADCGIITSVPLSNLVEGENTVRFEVEHGSYTLTSVEVRNTLKEPDYPVYYFDLDPSYFTASLDDEVCGLIDGVCPDGCSDDEDKDCCFEDHNNYWCDFETSQLNDRCVSHVSSSTCNRCVSGYEDYRGRAADDCEGLCGDDFDDECLPGCSVYVDKDCCFEYSSDTYWCDDFPTGKPTTAFCKEGVEMDERSSCPNRYVNEDGQRLSFSADTSDEVELKSSYSVMLELRFPDKDHKSMELLVNGRSVGVNTYMTSWEKDISDYVLEGTNSVKIVPAASFDIASLIVKVENR